MKENIIFTKVRDVKSPTRSNIHDAGIDFYIPTIDSKTREDICKINIEDSFVFTNSGIILNPLSRILIPSGIKVWIENKHSSLVAANKSGVATKKGLIYTCEVVDADYTGEIHIGVYNTNNDTVILEEGEKIIQFLHLPIILSTLEEIKLEQYNSLISNMNIDRGDKGFGSTGNK